MAAALQLSAAFWAIPTYGLPGLAWLQLAYVLFQTAGCLVIGYLLIRQHSGRWHWLARSDLFELIRFGAGLQLNAVAQMLFEPTAKALITHFGGLVMTGYFEVANRAVTQLRMLVVTAFQMLVPYVAGKFQHAELARLRTPYLRSFKLMQAMLACGLPVLVALLPIAIPLWVTIDATALIWFAWVCAFGWAINMLTTPAYFFALAVGRGSLDR